ERRKEFFAPLLDEVTQRSEGDRAWLGLELLRDDEREGNFRFVFLGRVVDDLYVLPSAHHLRDLQERYVAAVARIVQLTVRVPFDNAAASFRASSQRGSSFFSRSRARRHLAAGSVKCHSRNSDGSDGRYRSLSVRGR